MNLENMKNMSRININNKNMLVDLKNMNMKNTNNENMNMGSIKNMSRSNICST